MIYVFRATNGVFDMDQTAISAITAKQRLRSVITEHEAEITTVLSELSWLLKNVGKLAKDLTP